MEPSLGNLRLSALVDHSLSSVSSTTAVVTRFVRGVRSSHADLSTITHELADLRLVLELLRDDPNIPTPLQSYIPALLDDCGDCLARIDVALTHCDSTRWASGPSKQEITRQHGKLGLLRRALALVIDVVTLTTSRPGESSSDATSIHIIDEVEQIRLLQHGFDDSAGPPALDSFLDAVLQSTGLSHSKKRGGRGTGDSTQASLNAALDALRLQNQSRGASGADEDSSPLNTWSPSRSPPLPHRSPYPEPVSFEQLQQLRKAPQTQQLLGQPQSLQQLQQLEYLEHLQSSNQLPQQSPFVRPLFANSPSGRSSPSIQPPTPSSTSIWSSFRPSWASSASPTSQSDSLGVKKPSESPILQPERWAEHLRATGPHIPHTPSPSISSVHTRSQSHSSAPLHSSSARSLSSSNGHGFSLSQGSMYPFRSGSPILPPGLPTPAMSYQRPVTPRSVTPLPDQRPSTPLSIAAFPSAFEPMELLQTHRSKGSSLSQGSSKPRKRSTPLNIRPAGQFSEKGKSQDVAYIDVSPTSSLMATRHTSKYLKIWSLSKNGVHSTIKVTSYVQPQIRSREYFVRSHVILSENANLIGVSTHFGVTLEIYNFSKGGSGAKKVQVIDDAHRWAASKLDAYHTDYPPLVVYRPKADRIDRFFLARHPNAKKPFWEDATNGIELNKADLPFVPKFPELAYSANSPLLIAAAGPRPGEAPRACPTILIAWKMTPMSDAKLQAMSPVESVRSFGSDPESQHRPYRICVPEYPALQTALPTSLAARGSRAVSIWIPANHTETQLPGNKYKRKPLPAPERFVLSWDVDNNTTTIFPIPNVHACISPDCQLVAYCDANAGRFVVLDAETGDELWRWPDAGRGAELPSYGQLEDLHKISVFEFSADGQNLFVGDTSGVVGMYSVRDAKEPEAVYELQDTTAGNRVSTESAILPSGLGGLGTQKISELES